MRQPIQVYLNRSERAALDRLARDLDVSRAEVLRRGLAALTESGESYDYDPMDDLVGAFSRVRTPRDLSQRHDDHLARDVERQWRGTQKRSS